MDRHDRAKCLEARTRGTWKLFQAGLLVSLVSAGGAYAQVVLTGCAGGDFADDCSVAELVAGGSIQIDNSVFASWSYSENGIPASAIQVVPIGEGTTDPGPGVRITAPGLGADASDDYELNYDVTTSDGTRTLDGYSVGIGFGQITGAAGGFAATEVVDNDSMKEIACEGVVPCEEPVPDQTNPVLSDIFTDEDSGDAVFSKDFNVNTNMMAFTGAGEALERIELEQSFLVGVPEPGAPLLIVAGSCMLGAVHRLRRSVANRSLRERSPAR